MRYGYGRCGLLLLAGVAVGVLGVALLSRGRLRPLCVDMVNRGLDIKDRAAEVIETARERVEDVVAEARYQKEQQKEQDASVKEASTPSA